VRDVFFAGSGKGIGAVRVVSKVTGKRFRWGISGAGDGVGKYVGTATKKPILFMNIKALWREPEEGFGGPKVVHPKGGQDVNF
jgi:hypothetical protein